MSRFEGARVVVTGGGRGIGRAVALGFAREGAHVAVLARSAPEVAAVADEICAAGGTAMAVTCDVADDALLRRRGTEIMATLGGVDVLVNAAGVFSLGPTESFTTADARHLLNTNVIGTLLSTQVFGRPMLDQGRGKIINFGSLLSFTAFPERAAYAASKGGVTQLTRAVAVEWASRGINVNAVAPGMIEIERPHPGGLDEDEIVRRIPARRRGRPGDIVGPVLFLASSEADYIYGETLVVDGGWLSYGYL